MYVLHMDNFTALVAKKVVAAIEAGGQTELGIAEATGIPRVTLRRRLQGLNSFTVAELKAIATVLDIKVSDLTAEDAA